MNLDRRKLNEFRERVWEFYRDNARNTLPWRREVTPYGVFVSEVMLQQTQVSRVLERYGRWLERFPGFTELAGASTHDVLGEWQGMGYNRRALWLKGAASMVTDNYGGSLPRDPEELVKLPGVGAHTAGSMAAFAYEVPTVFIETNIRRVFIHEFFHDREGVGDAGVRDTEIWPLVEAVVRLVVAEGESPREWYWALMDYGSDLARRVPNPNRRSKHYVVQSAFEGSVRQLRGEVLRRLLEGPQSMSELGAAMETRGLSVVDKRLEAVVVALVREGFVRREGNVLMLEE